MQHFTSFFLIFKLNLLVKRIFFLSIAAFAMAILDLISRVHFHNLLSRYPNRKFSQFFSVSRHLHRSPLHFPQITACLYRMTHRSIFRVFTEDSSTRNFSAKFWMLTNFRSSAIFEQLHCTCNVNRVRYFSARWRTIAVGVVSTQAPTVELPRHYLYTFWTCDQMAVV